MTWIDFDGLLIDDIEARFDLRAPNKAAIKAVAEAIAQGDGREIVCDLATGVGKTYIMRGLVDYLSAKGVRNILIVTPGSTIQAKTIANFTPGNRKFIPGADTEPLIVTAENFSRGQVGDALHDTNVAKLFIFNVQQLIRPSAKTSRKVRDVDEFIGTGLYQHLEQVNDLVVIADEHHIYSENAKSFNRAIADLHPRAVVGLTATPAPGTVPIYHYSLADAIADGLVKIPVIVYRRDGRKDEETVLADACLLLRLKDDAWTRWAQTQNRTPVRPVLFVVCKDIDDANRVAERLTKEDLFPEENAVLVITSESSDEALRALEAVEDPDSPVRVVVSVNKLKEGWDVKNIGVIVGLRALASETLTEQVLGRGLRLPYGERVGVPMIDQVDLVAHESYRELLKNKDVLHQRLTPTVGGEEINAPGSPAPAQGQPEQMKASGEAPQPTLDFRTLPRIVEGDRHDGDIILLGQSMEETESQAKRDNDAVTKLLARVPDAPTIRFPRREQEVLPVKFSFSLITSASAQAEGAAYSTEFTIDLSRKALDSQRDMNDDVKVSITDAGSVDATQRAIPVEEVRKELFERVWNSSYVDESIPEVNAADRVIDAFLTGAGVTDAQATHEWGEARTRQAVDALHGLVRAAYENRKLQPHYVFRPVTVPAVPPRGMPSNVADRYEDFQRGKWYSGWTKSIEPVATFDAKSTEWALADIFDSSSATRWWLRLYDKGEVYIERDNGRRYYPDFIVIDQDDTHWLVEAKADDRVKDAEVQEKRRAAEEWARFVRDTGEFGTWRYLFVTESMIAKAYGNWHQLIALAKPEI